MENVEFFAKIIYLFIAKRSSIIHDQDIRNPEAIDDMLIDEGGYHLTMSSSQRNGFHLFSKVLYSSQDKLVLQRRGWGYSFEIFAAGWYPYV